MRTIAVIARKGGAGKSTVTLHLALAAHLRGRSVLLADTDAQRSSSLVLKGREGSGPQIVETTGPKLFPLQLSAQRTGVELIIIDTPAAIEEELSYAVVAADACLLIIRPTFLDLAAAAMTIEVVRRLRKPLLVLVNQAPPARAGVEPPSVKRALRALELLRVPVIPAHMRSRTAYQTAVDTGRSVEEIEGAAEAAQEVAAVWTFLSGFIFGRAEQKAGETQAAS